MFGDIDLRAFRALNIRESQKGSRQPSQSAYVRAYSSCFGEERRYIVGPGGDAWYKLRSGRYQMGAEKDPRFPGAPGSHRFLHAPAGQYGKRQPVIKPAGT